VRRFDPKSATPFVNKSVSEATRRAYGRALREFFQSAGMKHPSEVVHSGGEHAPLFQPHTNYRTPDFDKPLSTRMVQRIVKRWADYSRLGDRSPHDLRRTAITRALESGLTYRQVQMMSKHRDPKTVMRYDHGRENMEQNAVNFLAYDDEA
jgi:integrase